MLDFIYCNPVKIIFGKDKIGRLSKEIRKEKRVLFTYGGGSIKKNGVYDKVKSVLAGYKLYEFGGIEPNPSYETLMKAVEIVKQERIDFLLAVGGGSVIDGTKFVAAAAKFNSGDPWSILSENAKILDALPIGTVLTMPATGSEMNGNAVISKKSTKEKLAFHSPKIYPQFSILDPTLTFSLPAKETANGIVDAFIHVMEQYLTYPVNSPIQDRFAEGILSTLIGEGPKVLSNLQDYEARSNIMWSATLALNHLIAAGVPGDWSTHLIGHEITAEYGLAHGETLAIIWPALAKVMLEQKLDKLLQYGERVWRIKSNGYSSPKEAAELAIARTSRFFEEMGVKTKLSDYGIGPQAVLVLVAKLEKHGMTKMGERGTITLDVCKRIIENSL